MNLPGYKADPALAERLLDLQERARVERRGNYFKAAVGKPPDTTQAQAYCKALCAAWEAGLLCPVINIKLSKEDIDHAI